MFIRRLRRFVRRHTRPIPLSNAEKWSRRLNYAYIILAWHAFGGVCYMMYTGRADWAKFYGVKTEEESMIPPAVSFSKILNIPNAKVIKLSGLKKVDEYEIKEGEALKKETHELELVQ